MFLTLFTGLKQAGVPVTLREYLTLMEAMSRRVVAASSEDFYYLARACLVKDERHLDRFDLVFAKVFKGIVPAGEAMLAAVPEDWLRKLTERYLSDEENALVEALGGFDRIMEELRKRLAAQQGRHQGGSKWIGTAGTSPYGAFGYNPAGVRIGQDENRNNRAIKVWDRREFRDLDDRTELGTRAIKLALRRLRRFAREGSAEELDLDGTIRATANRGYLDLKLVPERRNAVKVLLFLDVGGSMDPHVRACEELFSAVRGEFKRLAHFYFHNAIYESVWTENRRRTQRTSTFDVLHTYASDYKVVIVGDASMSPFELTQAGGSVEHYNEEPGLVWLERLTADFPHVVWINPMREAHWGHTASLQLISRTLGGRMYPLTLGGLDRAMRELAR